MASSDRGLPHIAVQGSAASRRIAPPVSGPNPKIRLVTDRRQHGLDLKAQTETAFALSDGARRLLEEDLAELKATGSIITIQGFGAGYKLKLESLDSGLPGKPWILLAVNTTSDGAEEATVWVRDKARPQFLKRFQEYAEGDLNKAGVPPHGELVANFARVRQTALDDLWTSGVAPRQEDVGWWEVWLRDSGHDDPQAEFFGWAQRRDLRVSRRQFRLKGVVVAWVHARWGQLAELLVLDVPLAELRMPNLVDSFADATAEEQSEYVDDLASRLTPAGAGAPAVCLLDTGIDREHPLLRGSASSEVHSVVGHPLRDRRGHGTAMAGLALFGQGLEAVLLGTGEHALGHGLESVKMLPDPDRQETDPLAYGVVTADAVAQPEALAPRRPRVFSLTITSSGSDLQERATLWSATLDALAAGATVDRTSSGDLSVLSGPEASSARLFFVSAGNVEGGEFGHDHLAVSQQSLIEDPSHAYNAVTVGAMTELTSLPDHPSFDGWAAVAAAGDLSPHSRTSHGQPHLPIKPDICMEGGNVLTDGKGDFASPPAVSILTTGLRRAGEERALAYAQATSAATAQAARLAAVLAADKPGLWPETIRGLVVHSARWTPQMRARLRASGNSRAEAIRLLRTYGWGVPDEARALRSSRNAVTMVIEDSYAPFGRAIEDDKERRFSRLRLHRLPWPIEALRELDAGTAKLRVTLSYFVEPNPRRRGWHGRYVYPSHQLRFEIKGPTEDRERFAARVARKAKKEDKTDRWAVGPTERHQGSLHQDIWEGPGAELAEQGELAVFPVSGWSTRAGRAGREEATIRYALILSLESKQDIDLYSPIAAAATVAAESIDV